jgi:hypothetical protein
MRLQQILDGNGDSSGKSDAAGIRNLLHFLTSRFIWVYASIILMWTVHEVTSIDSRLSRNIYIHNFKHEPIPFLLR